MTYTLDFCFLKESFASVNIKVLQKKRGVGVAQLVRRPTLDCSLGLKLRIMRSSAVLSVEPVPPNLCERALSLSLSNT